MGETKKSHVSTKSSSDSSGNPANKSVPTQIPGTFSTADKKNSAFRLNVFVSLISKSCRTRIAWGREDKALKGVRISHHAEQLQRYSCRLNATYSKTI